MLSCCEWTTSDFFPRQSISLHLLFFLRCPLFISERNSCQSRHLIAQLLCRVDETQAHEHHWSVGWKLATIFALPYLRKVHMPCFEVIRWLFAAKQICKQAFWHFHEQNWSGVELTSCMFDKHGLVLASCSWGLKLCSKNWKAFFNSKKVRSMVRQWRLNIQFSDQQNVFHDKI